jgi:uncharacterized protein (DUF1684 family)
MLRFAMRKIFIISGIVAVIGLLLYSWTDTQTPAPTDDPAYLARIRLARQQKDDAFRTAASSPIPVAQRAAFNGLRYFRPDGAYRVTAQLARAAVLAPLPLALTRGSADAYARWGTATFELGGRPHTLVLLQKQGLGTNPNELFLPFTDPTNGQQTYAAGRYLDLAVPAPAATTIELDFNTAYSPFCAYNHEYSCPRPPADNRLPVPVLAGEQQYQP